MNIENCDFCDSHSSKINTTFNGTFCSCFVRCFKTILIIHDTIVSKGNILRNLNKLQFGSNSTHLSHSATTNTHQTNEHFFRLLAKWNVIYFGKMCRFFWWWFHWLSNVHKKVIWNLHCFFFLKKKNYYGSIRLLKIQIHLHKTAHSKNRSFWTSRIQFIVLDFLELLFFPQNRIFSIHI